MPLGRGRPMISEQIKVLRQGVVSGHTEISLHAVQT